MQTFSFVYPKMAEPKAELAQSHETPTIVAR